MIGFSYLKIESESETRAVLIYESIAQIFLDI